MGLYTWTSCRDKPSQYRCMGTKLQAAPSLCLTSRAGEKIASRLARVRCASSNESEADVITEAAARSEGEMKCGCGNCDGEGRIIGGMGSLPGFGWWPIKAYRPCPNFVQSGQQYKRKGQITDDIMFGRKGEQTRF